MNRVLFGSIFTKGIGAVIEVMIQILIIHFLSVDLYGVYGYYISMADIGFWVLFSAFSKCNMFYCAQKGSSISDFRKKYYCRYVIPVMLVLMTVTVFSHDKKLFFVMLILLFEVLVFDKSSFLLAKSKYKESILGEYCLGRVLLVCCILLFGAMNRLTIGVLLGLYAFQYFAVLVFFLFTARKEEKAEEQKQVDVKKLLVFQYGDVLTGVIGKAPVILQYLFVGAFEAGFVNLVSLVRTLVSFVSGPTSKVFLPEFSRLYVKGDLSQVSKLFRTVIRMQMMFLTAVGVCLIGFPKVILELFSKELLDYSGVLSGISACFLIGLSFGPCSGLMQMTNREKKDILIRSVSVVIMILTWIFTRENSLFVLFGIGTQILCENLIDYIYISRVLGKMPVSLLQYIGLWSPMLLILGIIRIFDISQNFLNLLIMTFITVCLYGLMLLFSQEIRADIKNHIEKKRGRSFGHL